MRAYSWNSNAVSCIALLHLQFLMVMIALRISLNMVVADHETESANEDSKQTGREIHEIDGMQWKVQYKPPDSDCHEISTIGDRLEVHYTGFLENGMVFDSSIEKKRAPIAFTLGAKQVIEGWEKGLIGMCVGEKRRLVVPPHLGYGDAGFPPSIPPRAKLLFEVTLVTLQQREIMSNYIENGVNMIKLFAMPIVLVYVIFYLRSRYKAEEAVQKDEKKKTKKRK